MLYAAKWVFDPLPGTSIVGRAPDSMVESTSAIIAKP
jgi:hypothetical protein